ncbi:MAG: hypothetical protein IJM24_01655 [Clostridia bacterium]|nr:hypothetical protein [Clostridia bacterium]
MFTFQARQDFEKAPARVKSEKPASARLSLPFPGARAAKIKKAGKRASLFAFSRRRAAKIKKAGKRAPLFAFSRRPRGRNPKSRQARVSFCLFQAPERPKSKKPASAHLSLPFPGARAILGNAKGRRDSA